MMKSILTFISAELIVLIAEDLKMSGKSVDTISFKVNGVKYIISNTSPKTSLNEWLRSQPGLKGNGRIVMFRGWGKQADEDAEY